MFSCFRNKFIDALGISTAELKWQLILKYIGQTLRRQSIQILFLSTLKEEHVMSKLRFIYS